MKRCYLDHRTLLALLLLVLVFFFARWKRTRELYHFHEYKPLPRLRLETDDSRHLSYAELSYVHAQLKKELGQAGETKIILIWYPPYGDDQPRSIAKEVCGNCEITSDRSKITDDATAAVLFHFNEISRFSMPSLSKRNRSQLHIFWTQEAPTYLKEFMRLTLKYEDHYGFNATMSYRRDSDFFTPYGSRKGAEGHVRRSKFIAKDLMKRKSKLALALISNCGLTFSSRLRLHIVREVLDSGFNLEVHGKCFPGMSAFAKNDSFVLEKAIQYKFYFSFENSHHCRDYVTEKFFRTASQGGVVPVVWGATREDYEALAPLGSFIYVDDFSSVKELVGYLNYLDKNDTAYMEYFRWYDTPEDNRGEMLPVDENGYVDGFCGICLAVHGINFADVYNQNYDKNTWPRPLFSSKVSPRTVSLRDWFYKQENPECLRTS